MLVERDQEERERAMATDTAVMDHRKSKKRAPVLGSHSQKNEDAPQILELLECALAN